jgi:hypothetical protein
MPSRFAFTPVKRSHLIQGSGVGSLIRLRSGVTALVLDLDSWYSAIPTGRAGGFNKDEIREQRLTKHRLRDPELEAATGAPFFVEPPPGPPDDVNVIDDWILPAVRFPRWAACANQRCARIMKASTDEYRELRGKARGCTCGGQNPRSRRPFLQVPVMLVCPAGHIGEIDWIASAHNNGPVCDAPDVRVRFGSSVKRPHVVCENCEHSHDPSDDFSMKCSGSRPWTGLPVEQCDEKMRVVERTNVSVYFANVKSSIYIPDANTDNEKLTAWLSTLDLNLIMDSPEDANGLRRLLTRAKAYGFGDEVDLAVLQVHVRRLMTSANKDSQPWDELAARARELNTLSLNPTSPAIASRLLRLHRPKQRDISGHCKPGGIIDDVIAVDRLTETRVHDGFSRWRPAAVIDQAQSQRLMWGGRSIPKAKRWLPGYRVTGEGILFILSATALDRWLTRIGADVSRPTDLDPKKLSTAGIAAHTLAHAIMRMLSDRSGYPLPGIRDRIYDLPDGRVAFLVYTADGDTFGTLGGLVEHAEGSKLASLIDDSIDSLRWCAQDPVCNSAKADGELRDEGACHHCVLVPETSCERFNSDLDRGRIIGATDRSLIGFL